MSTVINELKKINMEKIKESEKINPDGEEYKMQLIIMKILNSSENCFLNLSIDSSYDILKCLIDEDKVEETYRELMSFEEYKKNKN